MRPSPSEASLIKPISLLTLEQLSEMVNELHLTRRQSEIVLLVLQAKRDKEIAITLGLQVSTVRMHLRYVYHRLGIRERMELFIVAFGRYCQKCSHSKGCIHRKQPKTKLA